MNIMNMPGFTAEAALRAEGESSIYREMLREFDTLSGVVPAVSCSSKDRKVDCFCGADGCKRTQTNCTCIKAVQGEPQ